MQLLGYSAILSEDAQALFIDAFSSNTVCFFDKCHKINFKN